MQPNPADCKHEKTKVVRRQYGSIYRQCQRCWYFVRHLERSKSGHLVEGPADEERGREAWRMDTEARAKKDREERGQITYAEYLQTPHWKALSTRILEQRPWCQRCDTAGGHVPATEVHHITYANLGNESAWELLAVCRECHEQIHNK